jgi:hypothetical protein
MRAIHGFVCVALLIGLAWPVSGGAQWIPGYPTGRWMWEEQRDRITDIPIRVGYVHTFQASIAGNSEPDVATVLVYCVGPDPALEFRWGRSAAGSKNLNVAFRFEGQPGHVTKARYLNRTEQRTTDVADVRIFLDGLAKSSRLYVRATSDLYGISAASFRLRGGTEIVERLRRTCPILAGSD